MKRLSFKGILISLASFLLLGGCSGGTDELDTSPSTYVVYAMTEVDQGTQTFQQRALDYDGVEEAEDESIYVYKDRSSSGEPTSVVFKSASSEGTDTEELVVSAATDINDTYTAFSIDDVTIKVDGTNYSGDYILVQDKEEGDLYPVVLENYLPLANTEVSETVYWMNEYRHSNIADQDRIYMNDSEDGNLYVFEFDGDYFVRIDILAYNGDSFWVNEDGDILTQGENAKGAMALFDRSSNETINEVFEVSTLLPFLYDGEFYSARTGSDLTYLLEKTTTDFSWNPDSSVFTDNSDDYEPSNQLAARRGNYEMTSDCQLYYFDGSNPFAISIDLVADVDNLGLTEGALAVAGQDALFCVYSDGGDPAILKYDTETEEVATYTAAEGDLSDAVDYFTVISDSEVMFSEQASGSFEEYYIDLDEEETSVIQATNSSIVFLQRL